MASYALEWVAKQKNDWFPHRPDTSGKLGYYSAKQKWVSGVKLIKFISKLLN